MPKYTHNTRYTEKRLRPQYKRRMDCPCCDQWRTCIDTGKGYACEECLAARELESNVLEFAPI